MIRDDQGPNISKSPGMFLVKLKTSLAACDNPEEPTTATAYTMAITGREDGKPKLQALTKFSTIVNYNKDISLSIGSYAWCEWNMSVIVVVMEA